MSAPFGLVLAAFAVFPTQIGYQDLATLFARQPSVAAHWHEHLLASPFGTIHAAIFSFPRPLGSDVPTPPGLQRVRLDPDADITAALPDRPRGGARTAGYLFPRVERELKGDLMVVWPAPPPPPDTSAATPEAADDPVGAELTAALHAPPLTEYDIWGPIEADPQVPGFIPTELVDPDQAQQAWGRPADNASVQAAHLYFGGDPMGDAAGLERWAPGDEPVEVDHRANEAGTRQAMLSPPAETPATAPKADAKSDVPAGTTPDKGEVTAERKGLQSPAERLGLAGKARDKAEKCLANAVYFEARGEPVRGQIAVAQVVMNRVFSGFYPDNVCGVVYQNASHHLACQFTFACDGIPDVVNEPVAWERAKRIAKDTLDGKLWLPEVGKATHYHAYWVRPSWVHEMKKLYRLGVHTFYRPRAWGNGADAPVWGDPATTATEAAKL